MKIIAKNAKKEKGGMAEQSAFPEIFDETRYFKHHKEPLELFRPQKIDYSRCLWYNPRL